GCSMGTRRSPTGPGWTAYVSSPECECRPTTTPVVHPSGCRSPKAQEIDRMETRLEAVRRILDAAVGNRNLRHQGKGRFWNLPRDQFVAAVVYGQQEIVPGDPTASALMNAIRGLAPFDGSQFPRMPTGHT